MMFRPSEGEDFHKLMDALMSPGQTVANNAGGATGPQEPSDDRTMNSSDYRHELAVRDEQLRREIDMRHEFLRNEQAARDKALDERLSGFYAAQAERDKRYEMLAERALKAAEGAEEAAKQAATVKSNYWAAVVVQLLAVVAIVVGAYFALHQSNQSVAQTVQSSYQMGREDGRKEDSKPPLIPAGK